MINQILRAASLAVAIVLALTPTCAWAQQVGQASAIKTAAYQQAPTQSQAELKLQDAIIWKSTLSTPSNGALEVKFLDESKLSMGANSSVVIDEFTYSGPGGAGQQTLRYTKGLFRFVSGHVPKDKVKIETPAVSIGIRGTIFRTQVNEDGSGEVSVDYGPNGETYEIILVSKKTGKTLVLHSGQKVSFDGDGVFEGVTDGTIEGCGP
ncbi:MAG: FecR domain-containing protein [Micropepsaceae bacterium]